MPMVETLAIPAAVMSLGFIKAELAVTPAALFCKASARTNQHVRVISRSAADQVITPAFVPAHLRKAAHHLPAPNLL